MKKLLTCIILLLIAPTLFANDSELKQDRPASAGVYIGAVSPLSEGKIFDRLRPSFGVNLNTNLSSVFTLGLDGVVSINTSSWNSLLHSSNAIDHSYLGVYGSIDLFNLTSPISRRFFTIDLRAGCGWGHAFRIALPDRDCFVATTGLAFRFNLSRRCSLLLKPSVFWGFNDNLPAALSLQAGVNYCFGVCEGSAERYGTSEVNAINDGVNELRGRELVREQAVDNQMNSAYNVFFHAGSASISSDQMSSVQRIASHMNNNPSTCVSIKGYASREGNLKLNDSIALQRAFAVRNALISDFHIAPKRISAQGCGVGKLFEENAWNRVSVCTIFVK